MDHEFGIALCTFLASDKAKLSRHASLSCYVHALKFDSACDLSYSAFRRKYFLLNN